MRQLSVIISLLFLFAPLSLKSRTIAQGDDILEQIKTRGQASVEIAYPGFTMMNEIAKRFSVSSCDGKKAVLILAFRDAADFIKTGIAYKVLIPESSKAVYTASSVAEAMQWHSYPTWQQYDTIMHLIAETYPDICMLDTIGFSIQGRAVLVLKISDNASSDETDEPDVFYSSSIHGDELAGFILMLRLANTLASQSNNGGLAAKLVSGLEIWINPLANPDGMYRNNDTIISPVRANNNGYDLNRNFPDPDVTYPPPLQKETLEMIQFLKSKHFVLSANFHSGSEVVNYPWDKWLSIYHADDDWFNDISRRYADTVHTFSPASYLNDLDNGVTRGAVWYVISGGRQDYVTYERGGREVTIELDDIKQTPATELETMWVYNGHSLLRYLEEALYGIRGRVTDAETGLPLGAEVFIDGHDCDSSQVYSDTLSGDFYRFLSPGTWDLKFTCTGYKPYLAENITVTRDEATQLNIIMEKAEEEEYPPPPEKGILVYPVPTTGPVDILPPVDIYGEVRITIINSTGAVVDVIETHIESGIPFHYDLSGFAPGVYIIKVQGFPKGPAATEKILLSCCAQR